MQSMTRRRLGVVAAVWALATLPFLDKAFHIDDDAYLAVARHVAVDPWRPYSFPLHTALGWDSGWTDNHPPLVSYLLAAASGLDGGRQREVPLHFAMSMFTGLAAFALYGLAARFRAPPAFTTAVVLLSPVVLPGTNVMLDTPLLALGLAAILLHVEGVDRITPARVAAAALVAGLACLTRYPGVMLFPVLACYSVLRRAWWSLGYQLVGWLLPALWCAHNLVVYGRLHVLARAGVDAGRAAPGIGGGAVVVLVILGAAVAWIPLVATRSWRWLVVIGLALVTGMIVARGMERDRWAASLMIANGLVLAWAIPLRLRTAYGNGRGPDAVFLVAWCAAAILFAVCLPPFQAARHYELALAPAALLAAAESSAGGRALALVITVAVGLAVAAADAELAGAYRTVVRELAAETAGTGHQVWVTGEWGLGLYAERAGLKRAPMRPEAVAAGDLLVVARGVHHAPVAPDVLRRFTLLRTIEPPRRVPLRTMLDLRGFYAQTPWDVPYAITSRPTLDRLDVFVAG
jgi:hypothetical protein